MTPSCAQYFMFSGVIIESPRPSPSFMMAAEFGRAAVPNSRIGHRVRAWGRRLVSRFRALHYGPALAASRSAKELGSGGA